MRLISTLRFIIAVILGKAMVYIARLFPSGGTSLPGYIALTVDPFCLSRLACGFERIIVVTGTNGKTTTSNLIAALCQEQGWQVINNHEGANMAAGVVTALLRAPLKKGRRYLAVLEIDEGSLKRILSQIKADLLVLTNLFRDQLDRYCELQRLAAAIRSALALQPQCHLLLNADDPLVASLGSSRDKVLYYGMARVADSRQESGEVHEGKICPFCSTPLNFKYYHYSHLGDYSCGRCAFKRPRPDYLAQNLAGWNGGQHFELRFPGGSVTLETPLRGLYNIYNLVAASSAALASGVRPEIIAGVVARFQPGQGRTEVFHLGERLCTLLLVKNPAGLTQAVKAVVDERQAQAFILAINDLAADGRDVSWIWDAELTPLAGSNIKRLICSGLRAGDMALCLKYNGLPKEKIGVVPDKKESLQALLATDAEGLYILCTYTNLAPYRKLLQKWEKQSEAAHLPSLSRPA
ncbi:MAG: hypothetical protein PWP65_230 [Clostridia bacterium]|nr:hypothetical protein [Clostridia bacterium]